MNQTIELYEKYVANREELFELEALGIPIEKYKKHKYRRTNIRIEDIDRPIEIPCNKEECALRLKGGEKIYIKYNYDDLCIRLNDIWNSIIEE